MSNQPTLPVGTSRTQGDLASEMSSVFPLTSSGLNSSRNNLKSEAARSQPIGADTKATWEGRSLGEYLIGKQVGAGGNGIVYLAVHRWLERAVAIKFLSDIQAGDAQAVERFRREAQVAAHLIHPGIVRATDGGTVGNQVFLVTDFVDGSDLTGVVRRFQKNANQLGLPVADACEIALQAAEALEFIGTKGIVHRDIKPSNIMLDRSGKVRILDLGLARSQQHGHTMTATGQVMGTIDYMAPEQASDPRRVTHLADIYSLGCTLYFLLVGRPPLDTSSNDTLAAKLMATLDSEPPAINNLRGDIPPKLANLIHRMMEKDPVQRPQSFSQVQKELQQFTRSSDLSGLLSGSHEGSKARFKAKSYSIVDQLADLIERAMIYVLMMLALGCGLIEAEPIVRAGQRKRYRFSLRWLKAFGIILFVGFLIWAMGIRFVPPHETSDFL